MDHVRTRGGVLLGALVSGALAAGALGAGAPVANATCASFFGIGNSLNCTSNPTSIAIAIGNGAEANANGLFGAAFALGDQAFAITREGLTFAVATGNDAWADAGGWFGIALQFGANGSATTRGAGTGPFSFGPNIALNLSPSTTASQGTLVLARGIGNLALNLFGNATASNSLIVTSSNPGTIGSIILNVGGTDNTVGGAFGNFNVAFSALGSNNFVVAGPGPLALAGSIGQNNATVKKVGAGFNINGVVVGGAAAVRSSKTAAPSASSHGSTKRSTVPTAAGRGTTKRTAPTAAASRGAKRTAPTAAASRATKRTAAPDR